MAVFVHPSTVHSEKTHGPGEKRLLLAVVLNLTITVAEIVGGLLSGSLALLSDAVHNLGDTVSLGISYCARSYSKKSANLRKTFGYKRIEVVAAFFNLVVLAVISLLLVKEGVERAINPQPIRGELMLAVASIGLAANVLSAVLLHHDARHSLNVRSAYLHIVTDAASSVGVVVAAILILGFDLMVVDPIVTIVIAGIILYQVYRLLRKSADILMNSAPPDIRVRDVLTAMEQVNNVHDVHHIHVWSLDEHSVALEAHVVIDPEHIHHMSRIKSEIKSELEERFGISHSTLEFEIDPCDTPGECL